MHSIATLPHRTIILLATLAAVAVAVLAVIDVNAQEPPRGTISGIAVDATTPGQAGISWDTVTGVKDYRVMFARSDEDYKTWTDPSGNKFPATSSVTLTGLTEGQEYKFRVRSRFEEVQNGSRSGPWSDEHTFTPAEEPPPAPTPTSTPNPTSTPEPTPAPTPEPALPEAPTGLTLSGSSHNSVTLTWDNPDDDTVTGYQILRRNRDGNEYKDGQGAKQFIAVTEDTGSSATTYTDSSVTPMTRYVYRVKAKNANGMSPRSGYLNVETPAFPPPAAPTGLTVSATTSDSVTLEWDDPHDSNITKYQYRVSSDKGTTWDPDWTDVPSSDSTTTSHTVTDLDNGTSYTFEVRAVSNPKGKSATIRATLRQEPMVIGNLPLGGSLPLFGTIENAGERHQYRVQLEADKFYKIHICGCYTNETGFTKRQLRLLHGTSGDPVQIDGRDAVSSTHATWSGVYIYFAPTTTATYLVEVRASDLRQTGEYELSAYDATITSSSANEQVLIFDFELHDLADLYATDPADPVEGDLDSDGREHGVLVDVDYFEANLHSGRTYTFSFAASGVGSGNKFLWISADGPGSYRSNDFSPGFSGSSRTLNVTITPDRTGAYVFMIGIFRIGGLNPLGPHGAYTVTLTRS